MSLSGPRPEAATALVNRSLSDHGNGLGRGARGSGGSSGSLVADRGGGAAAAAAAAVALAPALSAMQRRNSERELASRWGTEAVAAAKAQAAERVRVDAGAAGEPERRARAEQAMDPAAAQPRATEEGDARVFPRPLPALTVAKPKPAPARGLWTHGKPRSKGRNCKRSSGRRSDEHRSQRPVTVDSSKARTSLDALKISIRQLKWKEVRRGPAAWAQGGGQDKLTGVGLAPACLRAELQRGAILEPAAAHPSGLVPKLLPPEGFSPLQVKLDTPSRCSPTALCSPALSTCPATLQTFVYVPVSSAGCCESGRPGTLPLALHLSSVCVALMWALGQFNSLYLGFRQT